ncbi:putative protein phloem protein 2-like a3 [Phtheirospermum japonicum]|uniref:AIG1-type G domain-containing protein n=1 Tax=Phtheirospermum japonicum TaxID=374723 RepID=A0A830DB91_9LAMI|nr:putative protein phloem protein 2-like a3 [Phtheirospermum japonicum]
MAKDGIHVVLVVLSTRCRFSREEEDAIEGLRKFFGRKISDYMIVVFTGGNDLAAQDETLDDYLGCECPKPLEENLKMCENICVLFDNRTNDASKKSQQLKHHLSLVDVVKRNGRKPYTTELFVQMETTTTFKQDISEFKEQLNKTYEAQLNKITEMVRSFIFVDSKSFFEDN